MGGSGTGTGRGDGSRPRCCGELGRWREEPDRGLAQRTPPRPCRRRSGPAADGDGQRFEARRPGDPRRGGNGARTHPLLQRRRDSGGDWHPQRVEPHHHGSHRRGALGGGVAPAHLRAHLARRGADHRVRAARRGGRVGSGSDAQCDHARPERNGVRGRLGGRFESGVGDRDRGRGRTSDHDATGLSHHHATDRRGLRHRRGGHRLRAAVQRSERGTGGRADRRDRQRRRRPRDLGAGPGGRRSRHGGGAIRRRDRGPGRRLLFGRGRAGAQGSAERRTGERVGDRHRRARGRRPGPRRLRARHHHLGAERRPGPHGVARSGPGPTRRSQRRDRRGHTRRGERPRVQRIAPAALAGRVRGRRPRDPPDRRHCDRDRRQGRVHLGHRGGRRVPLELGAGKIRRRDRCTRTPPTTGARGSCLCPRSRPGSR